MTRKLILEPEAEAEISEAANRYEVRSPGLGLHFLHAVEAALSAVQANPYQYQTVFREVRRVALSRFPYGLMYVASEEEIIVLACLHGRRNPKQWQRRVP